MLRKLMKHEFRATGRIMLPLFILAIVSALGANVSTRKLLEMDNNFLNVIGMLLLIAFVLAITAVCLVSFFLMIHRFYKNLLQDEAYVMMTLPVSVHMHIWSKLLVSLVWFAAAFVVVLLSILILAFDIQLLSDFFASIALIKLELQRLMQDERIIHIVLICAEIFVLLLVGGAVSCLQFYAPMAMGHSFSNRKVLMSVVFYFALTFAGQLISGLAAMFSESTGLDRRVSAVFSSMKGIASVHPVMIGFILYTLVVGAVLYAITAYCLQKRLNLE